MDDNNNLNNTNSQPNLSNKEIKELETHEASQKVAHVAGKGLATYYGGEAGAKIYDIASQTKAGQKIEELAGKAFETSPMAKPIARALDKSGALDAADKAVDMIGSKNAGTNNIANNPNMNRNMLKENNASTAKPVNNNFTHRNLGNQMQPVVAPLINIDESMIPEGVDPEEYMEALREQQLYEQQEYEEEMLRQEALEEERKEKQKETNKKIGELIAKNPKVALIIIAIIVVAFIVFCFLYMFVSDMDLVGTEMTSYDQAEAMSGYCQQIILIKEHSDFPGEAVSSIDEVDLSETFTLNGETYDRWDPTTYDLETYVKGVLQAEAIEVHDEKTFEVASIAARTYALQITSTKCYTWDNTNKREEYRNPQNFTSATPDSDISTAVSATSGLVLSLEEKLLNMENGNYYDYFCNIGKDVDGEEHVFYKMLQENEEERLLIPIDWAKENNAEGLTYSGKYDKACQNEGMSLFGAKYLLNKQADPYTTIRVLKYYYGYDTVIKRVTAAVSSGCYYWPTTSTTITSFFGLRTEPIPGASTNHGALDIGVARNSDVYATASGTVTKVYNGCSEGNSECGGGYGNYIIIEHSGGISSLYAHLSSSKVSEGSTVSQGQVIAASGNTGRSTGPHLHFEIRVNGVKVDPLNYVSITDTKPSCTTILAGGSAVNVGDSAKSICLSLKNYGFSSAAISAIMTNMSHESGLSSINLQNSYEGTYNDLTYTQAVDSGSYRNFANDSYGYGLVQWTSSGRKQGLYNYAVQTGSSIGDLKMQIDYFVYELQNGYSGLASTLKSSTNASSLTTQFCLDFESPANEETKCPARGASGNVTTYLNFANNNCQ